jgi:hypothetical protein
MTNEVCLVTGVGDGTGASVARRFAQGGHQVAMLARNQDRLDQLETEISGSKAFAFSLADLDRQHGCHQCRGLWLVHLSDYLRGCGFRHPGGLSDNHFWCRLGHHHIRRAALRLGLALSSVHSHGPDPDSAEKAQEGGGLNSASVVKRPCPGRVIRRRYQHSPTTSAFRSQSRRSLRRDHSAPQHSARMSPF